METINTYNDFLIMGSKSHWQNLLYPVELVPQDSPSLFGSQKFMVVRTDTRRVLSLVTEKYSLITNAEALELGKNILEHVYNEKFNNLVPTNILSNAESTRFVGSFMPENYTFDLVSGDKWAPFVYIQNSYDKSAPFRCWVGMGRVACLNGLIFGNVEVKISTKHKIDNVKYEIQKKLKVYQTDLNFQTQKKLYADAFSRLTEIPVMDEWVRPLVCMAFKVSYFNNKKDLRIEIDRINKRYLKRDFASMRNKCDNLMILMKIIDNYWKHYSESLGNNAYAIYNIVSDIATHDADRLNYLVDGKPSEIALTIKATQWAKRLADNLGDNITGIHEYIKNYMIFNEVPADECYVPH